MNNNNLEGTGFFRVDKVGDQWTFVKPEGGSFISLGVNHAEESNLKYDHNIDIWEEKYGSRDAWMRKGPLTDLPEWGFNTLGWTQDYVTGDCGGFDWANPVDFGHSFGWSPEELKASGMPYVVQLPVAEIQDWRGGVHFPDVFTEAFDHWCDFLVRSLLRTHAKSTNLLGIFYIDIPAWNPHAGGRFWPGMEGLTGDKYDHRLHEIAKQYYKTLYEKVKKVDPNHVIFGDRYNGNKGIPDPVLEAMEPYVDVLSIQYFPEPALDVESMISMMSAAQRRVNKPVMNIDIGNWTGTQMNPHRATGPSALASQDERGRVYANLLEALAEQPWFIGWQWCAYVENLARGWGIKDPWDQPYADFVKHLKVANQSVQAEHARKCGEH